MVIKAGQSNLKRQLNWTDEAEQVFTALKTAMSTAPTLVSPDYSKPLKLFAAEKKGYVNAMLMQDILASIF